MAISNEVRALLMEAAIDKLPWWSQKDHYSILHDIKNEGEVAISDPRTGEFEKEIKDENGKPIGNETITFYYWIYKINNTHFRVSKKMEECFKKGDFLRDEYDKMCGKMKVYKLKNIQDFYHQ